MDWGVLTLDLACSAFPRKFAGKMAMQKIAPFSGIKYGDLQFLNNIKF